LNFTEMFKPEKDGNRHRPNSEKRLPRGTKKKTGTKTKKAESGPNRGQRAMLLSGETPGKTIGGTKPPENYERWGA